MEHSVNDSFTMRLAIILKNNLNNTLKLFQNKSNYLHQLITKVHLFLQYHDANFLFCLVYSILVYFTR